MCEREKGKVFSFGRPAFLREIQASVFTQYERPSTKSLLDRSLRFKEERRNENRNNASISVNKEDVSDFK